jgi:hypothetical protein
LFQRRLFASSFAALQKMGIFLKRAEGEPLGVFAEKGRSS